MTMDPPFQVQLRATQVTCTLATVLAGMEPVPPVTVQFSPVGCAATVTV